MKCAKEYLLEREKMSQKIKVEIKKDTISFIEEILSPHFDTVFLQRDSCLLPFSTISKQSDCKIPYYQYTTINCKKYKIDFTFLKNYLKTYCIDATLVEEENEKYDIRFSLDLSCLEQ